MDIEDLMSIVYTIDGQVSEMESNELASSADTGGILQGCCYAPPLEEMAADLDVLCAECCANGWTPEDCDYYLGTLCSLLMHCACVCLDACDAFDESSALREACVFLLQNMESLLGTLPAVDSGAMAAHTAAIVACCTEVSACDLGSDESLQGCRGLLECCCEALECLGCTAASAKIKRCLNVL